jgi:hypothetical protein
MCDAVSYIAFNALTTYATYQAEGEAADELYEHKVTQQERTMTVAADAARHEWQGIAENTMQTRAAAAVDIQNSMDDARALAATGQVAAGAAGTMGNTSAERQWDWSMQFKKWHGARLQQLSFSERQNMARSYGVETKLAGRFAGATFDPIAQPSLLGSLGQVGASVAGAKGLFPNDPFWGA